MKIGSVLIHLNKLIAKSLWLAVSPICRCLKTRLLVIPFLFFFSQQTQAQQRCEDLFQDVPRSEEGIFRIAVYYAPENFNENPIVLEAINRHVDADLISFYLDSKIHKSLPYRIAGEHYAKELKKLSLANDQKLIEKYLDFISHQDIFIDFLKNSMFRDEKVKIRLVEWALDPKKSKALAPLFKIIEKIDQQQNHPTSVKIKIFAYEKRRAFIHTIDKLSTDILSKNLNTDLNQLAQLIEKIITESNKRGMDYIAELEKKEEAIVQANKEKREREKLVQSRYQKVKDLLERNLLTDTSLSEFQRQSEKNFIKEAFEAYFYRDSYITITKLFSYTWFKELSASDKKNIYILLLKMHHHARTSPNEQHARLIRNTADFITNGYYNLYLNQKPNGEGGYAGPMHISITFSNAQRLVQHIQSTKQWHLDFSHADYYALGTLAHEVSHIISGQKVEKSYDYFVEEYRASQVDYLATYGHLPSPAESLRRSLNLILNTSNLYPTITQAFLTYPAPFKEFLRSFFGKNTDMAYNFILVAVSPYNRSWGSITQNHDLLKQMVGLMDVGATSPELGWNGYLYNHPKSDDQKFKQPEFVSPKLIQKIDSLENSEQ